MQAKTGSIPLGISLTKHQYSVLKEPLHRSAEKSALRDTAVTFSTENESHNLQNRFDNVNIDGSFLAYLKDY